MTEKEQRLIKGIKLLLFDFLGHSRYKFHIGFVDVRPELPREKKYIGSFANMEDEKTKEFLGIIIRYLKSETEEL